MPFAKKKCLENNITVKTPKISFSSKLADHSTLVLTITIYTMRWMGHVNLIMNQMNSVHIFKPVSLDISIAVLSSQPRWLYQVVLSFRFSK
jgi:hypothetical protein